MKTLYWDKPEQVMSKEQWESISADGAPPGVYSNNMSPEDAKRWRAKLIKGADPRVEIRTSAAVCQMVIVVRPESKTPEPTKPGEGAKTAWREFWSALDRRFVLTVSMNGPAKFTTATFRQFFSAIIEAENALLTSVQDGGGNVV